ncbi:MAG: hypothetical protein QNJ65_11120 [Xenococcaceae cyanobacterium MO_234.B1]|nr:hypothetical protein [Xenococcaceae cyanobacterium MO_234.B1]
MLFNSYLWRQLKAPLPRFLAWELTFLSVIYGWVLFRAATLHDELEIIKTMTGFNGIVLPGEPRGRLAIITNFL